MLALFFSSGGLRSLPNTTFSYSVNKMAGWVGYLKSFLQKIISELVWLQVAEMYSKVCKPGKKKRAVPGSPPANPGFRTLGRGDRDRDRDGGFSVVVKPQTWAPQEGKAVGGPLDDHCYESIGTEECDLAYDNMEGGGAWKRERPPNMCATLRPRRKKAQQPLQQQQPPPPPPTQQTPKLQHLPAKALLLPGENLYESIGDLKQGSATSSTTTIFTFNDGMEMYVTGLWGSGCTVTPYPSNTRSWANATRSDGWAPVMLTHTYCLHSSHNVKPFTGSRGLEVVKLLCYDLGWIKSPIYYPYKESKGSEK